MRSATVREWLAAEGLPQYIELFEQNRIEVDVLPDLTERDLQDLGIPLGDRKRLLKAIQTPVQPKLGDAQAPPSPTGARDAERRQLTVMFCDLVGSTALSERLDPEELRDLMQTYQRACGEVISRYEGHVAQYLGDGLMVYFGWPTAHEDDASRAVRAGLETVEAVSKLSGPMPLCARVGIHTGLVVVGETGKGDASVPKAAVGDTPNIAARLQGLAAPGAVVISARTRSLAGGLFDYTALGAHALKGISEPVHLFQVAGTRATESRFEAARSEVALTALVGREEEVALLLHRWQQAEQGEGQVVLLGGEPGIGKSRLIQVLRDQIPGPSYIALRYQCSPYHVNSALYPIIEQFERAAGFDRQDSPEQKLDKMQALLTGSEAQIAEAAPLIAALLSLPAERYPALTLSPQKQKEKTLEALIGQIEALARRRPLLMVFEDAHWIDASSQEALDLLVPRLQGIPVSLIVSYRPEYTPRWAEQPHVTLIGLRRLGAHEAAELVTKVTGGRALPPEVLEKIVTHTDGVPLFVEELTKSILESNLLRDSGDRYVLDGPLPALAVPTTLRDSLVARLDRLAPIREVAQIGACIGREFSYELLAAVSPIKGKRLDQALEQLAETGLLNRRGTSPAVTYTFKHALMQDAAYDSLLKSKRHQLHAQIARVIETQLEGRAASQPELLAYHYTEAGDVERALPHWLAAGRASFQRFALAEAIGQLKRGLNLLPSLPPGADRDALELAFQATIGNAFVQAKGLAAPEAGVAFQRAHALCIAAPDPAVIAPVLWGVWLVKELGGESDQALQFAKEMVQLARDHREALLVARTALMDSLFWSGHLVAAREEFARAYALYDDSQDRGTGLKYGFDMKIVNLLYASQFLWMLGYPDQALAKKREMDDWANVLGNPFMHAFVNVFGATLFDYRGELDEHAGQNRHGYEIARAHGFTHFDCQAELWLGWNLGRRGQVQEGLRLYQKGFDGWKATSAYSEGFFLAYFGSLLAQNGQADEALGIVKHAIGSMQLHGQVGFLAEVHRLRGDILWRMGNATAAEAALRDALGVARRQHAKGWELRASTDLARLWQCQGKRKEALDLLGPIYNWFTEGFDTKDMLATRTLLDALH